MYPGDIAISYDGPEIVRKEKVKKNKAKKDKYVQQVKEKFEQRSQTGIKKYNTTLERNDLSLIEWLNHAQEEAMDLTLYLERIKAELKEKLNL